MIRSILFVTFTALLLATGCVSGPTPPQHIPHSDDQARVDAYQEKIKYLVKVIDATPDYQRIPLDTDEDTSWFAGLSFQYWDGQITKDEFMEKGLARFPDYRTSFELVANNLKD